MTDIYTSFDKATSNFSAFAIVGDKGQLIGRVVFKHGASRVDCFMHVMGVEMVRGSAGGGGYDKVTAAAEAAAAKIKPGTNGAAFTIKGLIGNKKDGVSWESPLIADGYNVHQIA